MFNKILLKLPECKFQLIISLQLFCLNFIFLYSFIKVFGTQIEKKRDAEKFFEIIVHLRYPFIRSFIFP